MIQAIETRYAGCRFRSRTEARWAVFLDAMGFAWEYEKEGYELPSGRYLPDFWLPDLMGGVWLEIKGGEPTARELKLAQELQAAHGSKVTFFCGSPGAHVEREADGKIIEWMIETPSIAKAIAAAKSARFDKPISRQAPVSPWLRAAQALEMSHAQSR